MTQRSDDSDVGRYVLEHRAHRHDVICALADGRTIRSVARDYDVAASSVSRFRKRWAEAIELQRRVAEDSLGDLWITRKRERVALYQQTVEDIERALVTMRERKLAPSPRLLKRMYDALKAVAEELGELPPRIAIDVGQTTTVSYSIEGVDMQRLLDDRQDDGEPEGGQQEDAA